MILTIIALIVTVVGIVMLNKINEWEAAYGIGLLFTMVGGIVTFIMAICIICAHVGVDAQIEENRIEYESLCQRYEIVTSEYEDVSKSDVIKDIAEWNKKVYGTKLRAYNPWTNWFYSKRIADELKMIERK